MKINILFIIESSETGGAETVFLELVQNIDRNLFVPYVALLYKGWLYEQLISKDILPFLIQTKQGGFDYKLFTEILTYSRKNNINIIHSHLFTTNLYSCVAGLLTRIPVISTFHGTMDVKVNDRFSWLKWLIVNQLSSKMVFVSQYLKDYFEDQYNIKYRNNSIIYNGINLDKFSIITDRVILRRNIGIAKDDFVVGCVGDLRPAKDYHTAIRSIAYLKDKISNIKLVIAGTKTDLLNELELLANELGVIENILFLGFRCDIEYILPTFDVYLSSSLSEGFSLTVVEAMASRVPVIATRCGGPEEIIDNELNGILIGKGDAKAIASKIEYIYSNRAFADKLTFEAAMNVAEKFSLSRMVNEYQSLYLALTG